MTFKFSIKAVKLHRKNFTCFLIFRWKGELKELECFLENLPFMRLVVAEKPIGETKAKKKERLANNKQLNNLELIEKIDTAIINLKPICELIDTVQASACTLPEAVNEWLNMKPLDGHMDAYLKRDKMFCSTPALISYSLDPRFKGEKLNKKKKKQVDEALLSILRTQKDLDDLENFRQSKFSFGAESLKNLSPTEYWKILEMEYPKLAKIAMTYVSLPSSTASLERLFSMWKHVHSITRNRLSSENSEMLAFIYYSLNVDSC